MLIVHSDGDTLDLLTRLFEASGCDVVAAVSAFRAHTHLESERPTDVVVAPWDTADRLGGDIYRWALQHRFDLRDQFVFIAADVPADFDRIVGGRCLAVSIARPAEIVRVAYAAVRRRQSLESRPPPIGELDDDKPTLLLAEDDPMLLSVMADLLADAGFSVVRAESGRSAIAQLETGEFDAIVSDWNMDGGGGAELVRWLREFKPWLVDRLILLSSDDADDAAGQAHGRPTVRKGQDSSVLIEKLRDIAQTSRQVPR